MELTTKCVNGLSMSTEIDPLVPDFFLGNKLPHISGSVRLKNDLQDTVTFSTARFLLSTENSPPTRAYINSVASQASDFSAIKVQKKDSQLNVMSIGLCLWKSA